MYNPSYIASRKHCHLLHTHLGETAVKWSNRLVLNVSGLFNLGRN
jgi:hypothetical protein